MRYFALPLVAVSKSVFQRKTLRLNPEAFRSSSIQRLANFTCWTSPTPLPETLNFGETPACARSSVISYPRCLGRTPLKNFPAHFMRFGGKRSVSAQEASFEPKILCRSSPFSVDNILSANPLFPKHVASKRSVVAAF